MNTFVVRVRRAIATRGVAGSILLAAAAAAAAAGLSAQGGSPTAPIGDRPERIDYLTFAQGAVPVRIGGAGAALGADMEAAVRIADGDPTAFTVVNRAPADVDVEFVYELPAPTTFDRFAVPNVTETPSPTTTFAKIVEVHGSSVSATDGFVLLASAALETHRARGLVTELAIATAPPVRWVRLRVAGGINIMQEASFIEFSEIIGNGTQEQPVMATHFTGIWRTQANRVRLTQQGPIVSGCYDAGGELTGTVTGTMLRATGIDRGTNVPSAFILSVGEDGGLRGVRSTNGSPFRLYTLAAAPADTAVPCGTPPTPTIGCGSIIHGIGFAFDSAEILPESAGVLAELYKGLQTNPDATILVEGHTSSEGTDAYNDRLSERRAQAVVDDLVQRGVPAARISAAGIGERRAIAPNTDESGRALNRRVEVKCQ